MAATKGRIKLLWDQWHHFNERFFGGKLRPPKTIRITSARMYDGKIYYSARGGQWEAKFHIPDVSIFLSTHQSPHAMTGSLLHEMVHQYQFQIMKVEPDHDATFNSWCRYIERCTGFSLRSNLKELYDPPEI